MLAVEKTRTCLYIESSVEWSHGTSPRMTDGSGSRPGWGGM